LSGSGDLKYNIMNTGLAASVLQFAIALWLTVSSALAGDTTQALLWGVITVIAVFMALKMRTVSGPAQV
jgi:hypothetical protein